MRRSFKRIPLIHILIDEDGFFYKCADSEIEIDFDTIAPECARRLLDAILPPKTELEQKGAN